MPSSRTRRWALAVLGVLGGVAVLAGIGFAYVWMFPGEFACDDAGQYETLHRETDSLGVSMAEWCDTDGTAGPMLTSGSVDDRGAQGLRAVLQDAGWTREDRYPSCASFRKPSGDDTVVLDLCGDGPTWDLVADIE